MNSRRKFAQALLWPTTLFTSSGLSVQAAEYTFTGMPVDDRWGTNRTTEGFL